MLRLCDEVCSVYLQHIISFALLVSQDWRPSMAGALLVHTPTSESHKSWSSWKKFDTAWKMAVAVVELSRGGSAAFPLFWCCLTRNKHTPLAENTDLSDIYFSSHRIAKTGNRLLGLNIISDVLRQFIDPSIDCIVWQRNSGKFVCSVFPQNEFCCPQYT